MKVEFSDVTLRLTGVEFQRLQRLFVELSIISHCKNDVMLEFVNKQKDIDVDLHSALESLLEISDMFSYSLATDSPLIDLVRQFRDL